MSDDSSNDYYVGDDVYSDYYGAEGGDKVWLMGVFRAKG
jgi:hypothetical protein